uniref:NADH-ubiquinone oxidoreductase chain 1 n=1 Tax=Epimeria frankei TaxID=2184360 RepID=A0A2S1TMA7_9CRUS|nr:NADH dehydrogenase subunit 1 [Epimeria frankei]
MLEGLKMSILYLSLVVVVLVSVAFVTLFEQKLLAGVQIRLGPNHVGYWGIFQPFADAVKLFNKEYLLLRAGSVSVYLFSPVVSLSLSLVLWVSVPLGPGGVDFFFSLLFFMVISGMGVYPVLSSGWSSNCKYSMLGSLRAVAQMVSYEVSLSVVLLSLVWTVKKFNSSDIMLEGLVWNLILIFPLGLIWFVSSLAETNRTPYDFSEGESELVSGFNTEYSAGGFTLIFMSEYANILFMSVLFSILFMSSGLMSWVVIFKGILVSGWFIWVRGTMPRYRYDKLMNLAWKSFLPVSLWMFGFYLLVNYVF